MIISPSYPDEYAFDEDCVYSITGGEDTYINLTILHFDLYEVNIYKCRGINTFDYLEVRDGDSMASPLIAIFCGSDKPTSLHSTQNKLWIRYMGKGSKILFLRTCHVFIYSQTEIEQFKNNVCFIIGIFDRFKSREWDYGELARVDTVTGAGFQMIYSIEECSLEICNKGNQPLDKSLLEFLLI